MSKTAAEQSAESRIWSLCDRLGNHSVCAKDAAAANLANNRAAFWTKATYANQPASQFVAEANRFGSIDRAQTSLAAYFEMNGRNVWAADWLDALLPLNPAAVDELARAYVAAGTFRMRAELIECTERAEGYFNDSLVMEAAE